MRAQKGLTLNNHKTVNDSETPPAEKVNKLVNLYNEGQLESVVEQAQALTKQYPHAFVVWNILGGCNIQIGMLNEAIKAYNKCISLKPNFVDAYVNLGIIYKNKGELDEALKALKKAILLNPVHEIAYNNIGLVLKKKENLMKLFHHSKSRLRLNLIMLLPTVIWVIRLKKSKES